MSRTAALCQSRVSIRERGRGSIIPQHQDADDWGTLVTSPLKKGNLILCGLCASAEEQIGPYADRKGIRGLQG